MARRKVWGPFICAGCGRKVPYLIVDETMTDAEARDESKTSIACFACHGSNRIASTALIHTTPEEAAHDR